AEGNLRVFLEKWCLIPGEPWQDEIERALDRSATCVVFVGPHGPSPWAHIEMRAFACLHALDMTGTACLSQSRSKSTLPVRHSSLILLKRKVVPEAQDGANLLALHNQRPS